MKSLSLHSIETRTGCIAAAMDIVGQKWTALILRDLSKGSCRFAELERSIFGINPRTLSGRLDSLKTHGIIIECPGGNGYELTPKGHDLLPILKAMADWGDKHA